MPEETYLDQLDEMPMEDLIAEGIVQTALALTNQVTWEFAVKRVDQILQVMNERIA